MSLSPSNDDYDVVIGVKVSDQTAAGSAQVKGSMNKLSEDVRQYGDRQAREISRNARTTFTNLNKDVSRSSDDMIKKLAMVFDQQNFLIRNIARQMGSSTASILIGAGKLGLSFSKFGKDAEGAGQMAKTALDDLKIAAGKLGTESGAFPAAIKAAKELSSAYQLMGLTGAASSAKAGNALEDAIHKRLTLVQGGLVKAQSEFNKLKTAGSSTSEDLRKKLNDVGSALTTILNVPKIDSQSLKALLSLKTEAEKYDFIVKNIGRDAAASFLRHQQDTEKLAKSYINLESKATSALKKQTEGLGGTSEKVLAYQTQLAAVENALTDTGVATEELTASTGGLTLAMGLGGAAIAAVLLVVIAIGAAFIAAGIAGTKFTEMAVQQSSVLKDWSDKTNFGVDTLQALQIGMAKSEVGTVKMITALAMFDKTIQTAYTSDTKLSKQFKDFGIDTSNNERALRQTFDALQKLGPGAEQTALAMTAFGKSGKDVLDVMKNLDGNVDKEIAKFKALGFILSDQDVKAAAALGDKFDVLKLKVSLLGAKIGLELIPYATKLVDKLDELANRVGPQVTSWTDQFINSVKNVSRAVKSLMELSPITGIGESAAQSNPGIVFSALFGATPLGEVVEVLTTTWNLLDKIGSKLHGAKAQTTTGISPEVEALMTQQAQGIDNAARIARGKLTATEKDIIEKETKSRVELLNSLKVKAAEVGEKTEVAATKERLLALKTTDLADAYKDLEPAINSANAALDRQIMTAAANVDNQKATRKAADDATRANEKATDELNGIVESISQANDKLGENANLTKLVTTETDKYNKRLAEGKYSKVTDANVLDNLKTRYLELDEALKQIADNKTAEKVALQQQKLADAIENVRDKVASAQAQTLTEATQRIAERHRNLTDTVKSISQLPGVDFIGGRETLDKFAQAVTKGTTPL
jgi:hypothetical protein